MRIVIDTKNPNIITDTSTTIAQRHPAATANLKQITKKLDARLGDSLPSSFLHGKTRMRNEVMDMLDCSAVRAERIVDTLVDNGHARFRKPPGPAHDPRVGQWRIQHNS